MMQSFEADVLYVPEILQLIFLMLNIGYRANMREVCKQWYNVLENSILWLDFEEGRPNILYNISFRGNMTSIRWLIRMRCITIDILRRNDYALFLSYCFETSTSSMLDVLADTGLTHDDVCWNEYFLLRRIIQHRQSTNSSLMECINLQQEIYDYDQDGELRKIHEEYVRIACEMQKMLINRFQLTNEVVDVAETNPIRYVTRDDTSED